MHILLLTPFTRTSDHHEIHGNHGFKLEPYVYDTGWVKGHGVRVKGPKTKPHDTVIPVIPLAYGVILL